MVAVKITLDDNYRLPSGNTIADVYRRVFSYQRREVLQYVRSGQTIPINFNGWIDYTVGLLLPHHLWNFAYGWKFQSSRLNKLIGSRGWTGLLKAVDTKENDDKKRKEALLLLGLIGLMNPLIVDEIKMTVRQIVTGIFATTAKWINVILAAADQRVQVPFDRKQQQAQIEAEVKKIFDKPERIILIGEDEAMRAYHYGMVRVLKESGFRWTKTWRTAEDEKVCPVCFPLHNKTVGIDESFASLPTGGTYASIYTLVNAPPAHSACRCRLRMEVIVDPAQIAYERRRIPMRV